jgi:hypothetical protein
MTQKSTFDFEALTHKIEVTYLSESDIAFCYNADPIAWFGVKSGWYWLNKRGKLFGPFASQAIAIENALTTTFGPSL